MNDAWAKSRYNWDTQHGIGPDGKPGLNPFRGDAPATLKDLYPGKWEQWRADWDKAHPAPPPPPPPPAGDPTTKPGYAAAAAQQSKALDSAKALETQGGVADALAQHYGGAPSNFDAQLLGTSGFADVQSKAQDLNDYLNRKNNAPQT